MSIVYQVYVNSSTPALIPSSAPVGNESMPRNAHRPIFLFHSLSPDTDQWWASPLHLPIAVMECTCVHPRKFRKSLFQQISSSFLINDVHSVAYRCCRFVENRSTKCYVNYTVHRFQCLKRPNKTSSRSYLQRITSLMLINYVNNCGGNLLWPSFDCSFLVGEAAGKAPLGVAKKEDVNMNQLRGKAESATGVVSDTRMVNIFVCSSWRQSKEFPFIRYRN